MLKSRWTINVGLEMDVLQPPSMVAGSINGLACRLVSGSSTDDAQLDTAFIACRSIDKGPMIYHKCNAGRPTYTEHDMVFAGCKKYRVHRQRIIRPELLLKNGLQHTIENISPKLRFQVFPKFAESSFCLLYRHPRFQLKSSSSQCQPSEPSNHGPKTGEACLPRASWRSLVS